MSIIVKGMEMPQCCLQCAFFSGQGCKATRILFPDWMNVASRPQGCPIRPLPEKHGRLIDIEALNTAFTGLRFNDDGTLRHWDDRKNWCLHGSEVENLIADAPTIVEAEGE